MLHPQTWGLQAAGEDPEGWLRDGLDIIGGFGLAVAERTPMYRNLDFHFGPVLTHIRQLYTPPPCARAPCNALSKVPHPDRVLTQ